MVYGCMDVWYDSSGLDSLSGLFPYFRACTQLRHIYASHNQLRHIDGLEEVCPKLESFDITENPIDLTRTIRTLQCLPHLRHLRIDLHTEQHETQCIQQLPQIITLNGCSKRNIHIHWNI